MAVALHPVASFASFTELKTGKPKCVVPPFFGVTPPTILVPYAMACTYLHLDGSRLWNGLFCNRESVLSVGHTCSEWKVPFLPVNP
jgi:hypothetical protein